jgi:predicted dehydrogenase
VTKTIRTAIAGYGKIGQRRKEVMEEHGGYEVIAVCDIRYPAEGVTLSDGIPAYQTYEKLLDLDIDALIVCLPNDVAADVVVAALKRGLHVFCEKPPGRNVADIEKVIAAERAAPGLKLKYGFNHRYHDSVIEALDIVQSGKFGKLLNMRGVYGKSAFIPWPRPTATGSDKDDRAQWRTSRAIAGGGILLDQGIHMVDLMLAFAGGPFSDVKSFVSNDFWKQDVEDNAYALMRNDDGVVAFLHSTATQWRHKFNLEIFLENGALQLTGILSGSKSYGEEKLTITPRVDKANGQPSETTESFIFDESWAREMAEFADCVANDKPVEVGTSGQALDSMKTVYAIYQADARWAEYTNSPA